MGDAKGELVPGHCGKIDVPVLVGESEISEDRGSRGILRTDCSLAAHEQAVGLVNIRGHRHVGRNDVVGDADAVHLNGKQDRDVDGGKLARELHDCGAPEAHAVDNQTNRAAFALVEHAVAVTVEAATNQLERELPFLFLNGLDVQPRQVPAAQRKRDLSYSLIFGVPRLEPARKANHETVAGR